MYDDDDGDDDNNNNNNDKITHTVQTTLRPLHCHHVATTLYKMPYLIRLLQRRTLVSDNVS